jgi:hypothetical protein
LQDSDEEKGEGDLGKKESWWKMRRRAKQKKAREEDAPTAKLSKAEKDYSEGCVLT